MCAWQVRHALRPEGPWHVPQMTVNGKAVHGRIFCNRSWEDPFLWQDARENWWVSAGTNGA
jgi:hypothetical protein